MKYNLKNLETLCCTTEINKRLWTNNITVTFLTANVLHSVLIFIVYSAWLWGDINQLNSVASRLTLYNRWIAACQVSLSITNSWSLPILMFIESMIPSKYLIFYCPLLLLPSNFPSIRVFSSGGQSIRDSASTSVLPMNIHDWSPLG